VTTAAAHLDTVALLQADRDQLTQSLRGLAARLDELDRRLVDLAWRVRGSQMGVALGEWLCERTALEQERERLSDRLGVLARQLESLDHRLADSDCPGIQPAGRVGTCPYCGYPSIGSGLCAFCRPHLAR
jgi:chromosome segregation ATPase